MAKQLTCLQGQNKQCAGMLVIAYYGKKCLDLIKTFNEVI